MKPKILYLITKSNLGGAQKYVFELAMSSKEQGFDITVGLGGTGGLKEKLENNEIRTITIPGLERDISILKEVSVFFNLLKLFKKEKLSVVHLNSSKIGALGALAARVSGIKNIIYTAHGWAFNEKVSFLSKIFRMLASWITILCSHKTIVLSEREKRQVAKWPFSLKKIVVIPIGIKPFDVLEKEQAKIQINIKEDSSTTIVGMIAELHKNKGVDIAIEAIKDLENVTLIVMGGGEEAESLKLKVKSEKLDDRVLLLGNIPEASKFLKAFDMLLISSRKEGLPYVLLEAGYAKVPVIASKVGGIPEIIKNYETGLLINPNPEEISKAIMQSINNKEKSEAMSENLYNLIKTDYSFDKMKTSTIALY